MAARAGRFPGNSAAGDRAIFLARERLGARHRISRVVVAGSCGTVERRHSFSAVGGVGEPRIRRAALHFLSAAVVDAGGGAELCGSAAIFGAACYAANPYALLNVYMRSDFAELLACALMPLVVLTALQLCGLVKNRRGSLPRAMAFFAVTFAAVWLSNAPAGVMARYSAAIIFA